MSAQQVKTIAFDWWKVALLLLAWGAGHIDLREKVAAMQAKQDVIYEIITQREYEANANQNRNGSASTAAVSRHP